MTRTKGFLLFLAGLFLIGNGHLADQWGGGNVAQIYQHYEGAWEGGGGGAQPPRPAGNPKPAAFVAGVLRLVVFDAGRGRRAKNCRGSGGAMRRKGAP